MHIMVFGGSGMLGHPTIVEALRRGHRVTATAMTRPAAAHAVPDVPYREMDVTQTTDEQLRELLAGVDVLVYSLGPDDRVVPPAPALAFFQERLAQQTARVARAARAAGVRRMVVFGSYFSTFDRLHPEWQLAAHHPYIQARQEQARLAVAAGAAGVMDVCLLEIPYVFGVTPGREPIWKDLLFNRILGQKHVLYPRGGTAMVTHHQVGEAAVHLAEHGTHGGRHPIGDVNMDWNTLISTVQVIAGEKPHVRNVPMFLAQLGMNAERRKGEREGKDHGLNLRYLMPDIMYRELYLDTAASRADLHFTPGGVPEALRETVLHCLPALRGS